MKKNALILFSIFFALILVSCSLLKPKPLSRDGFYFDTIINITIYDKNSKEAEKLLDEAFLLCQYYENLFSSTIDGSNIFRINNSTDFVEVSDETLDIIKKALYYCGISKGSFDITLGAVSSLWNFSHNPTLPKAGEIENALNSVGYNKIIIEGNRVKTSDLATKIDLGAIAKGYIADRLSDFLREKGVSSAIINLGGNVSTIGSKDNNQPFLVGIQDPFTETQEPIFIINSMDTSIVTSGVYQRNFTKDGVLYHHILDSATGYPCNNSLVSVSIISASSTDADALSTLCFTLGPDEGIKLIDTLTDTEAIFIRENGEILYSKNAKDFISH